MTCKITARIQRLENLRGRVTLEEQITMGVPRLAAPIVDGWYQDGVRQVRQFQQVLEDLRVQHQPEHWASWALDGSLEEDGGRFPLGMDNGWQWVDVGPRKAVVFDGTANAGLVYGTDEDFVFVHETRRFTMGAWVINPNPGPISILTTAGGRGTTQTGFNLFNSTITQYLDYTTVENYQRFSLSNAGIATTPTFVAWQCDNVQSIPFLEGRERNRQAIAGTPRTGQHTYTPFTIGAGSSATIFNAFCTSHILTGAEIYRLYVSGMADLMV